MRRCRLGLLLAVLSLWHVSVSAAPVHEDFRLWARVSFEALEWKTDFNQLTLAEGFELGSKGYLIDPYLFGYSVEGGIIDYHIRRLGEWNTTLGWRVMAMLNIFPASKVPIDLLFGHSALGLRPGGHPAFNLSNTTDVGAHFSLLYAAWPQVYLKVRYTLTDFNLGPGLYNPVFGENQLETYEQTRLRASLRVTRGTKVHSYEMRISLDDDDDDRLDRRMRRGRFYALDRARLNKQLEILGVVDGEVGQIGDRALEDAAPFSDYRAWLYLIYGQGRKLRINSRITFQQAEVDAARRTGGNVVGEAFWMPRKWIELFGGLALTYLDEEQTELRQREAREQIGLGARVFLPVPWVGGQVESKLLGRFGDGQALELGRGLFMSVDSYLRWLRRLGRSLEVSALGHVLYTRDRSPLGADNAVYEARAGLLRTGGTGLTLQGYFFIARREQEEVLEGSYTDTYTDLGGQLLASARLWEWLYVRATGGYSRFLTSDLGAQSSITASGHLMAVPSEGLRLQGSVLYVGRQQLGTLSSTVRVETELSWRLRQLSIDASYIFIHDDYRGLPGGDHRAMLRLVRTFDLSIGRRR